ncbi:hypothetical protein FOFC_20718 [Fusarium oxysporum]|nr:hypothetical protein FOFC_20718 [Fusarium oxysporum]
MGLCRSAHLDKARDVPSRRDVGQNGINPNAAEHQTSGMLQMMPNNTIDQTDLSTVAPPKQDDKGLGLLRYLTTSEETAQGLSYSVIRHLETSGASHYIGLIIAYYCHHREQRYIHRGRVHGHIGTQLKATRTERNGI